jgi:N-acetylglucosamine kinase-like BadF-type ATPase
MEERMRYMVGVDGGGTKTTAAVVSEERQEVGTGTTGPANARSVGLDRAGSNIAEAITAALAAAGLTLPDVSGICMSLAGFDTELDLPVPQQAVRDLAYTGPAIFENDVVGAWAGATGGEPGIVVISGTGATALGMNRRGDFWRTDGWDTLLGDAGSGYAIGRDGIRAAMAMLDGRLPAGELARAFGAAYGIHSAEDMRRLVDSSPFGKFEVAAFARRVSEAAKEDDAAAQEILRQAGRDLGANVAAIVTKLEMHDDTFPVTTVGSVATLRPWVSEAFEAAVRAAAPHATLQAPLHSPEVGAALLGFKRIADGDLGSWTLGTGKRHIRRSIAIGDIP